MLGEQAGKVRKAETEERKRQKVKGEAEKLPSPSPSPHLTTSRKAFYTQSVIKCVPPPSLVCAQLHCPVVDQVGNRLLGLEKSFLAPERHPLREQRPKSRGINGCYRGLATTVSPDALQALLTSLLAPSFTSNPSPYLLSWLTVLSLTLPAACHGLGDI